MAQYSLYLKGTLEKEILAEAKKLDISPSQVVIRRLEKAELGGRLDQLDYKVDAIFVLLDAIVGDLGYTAGAVRAASVKNKDADKEGTLLRDNFQRTAARLKLLFQLPDRRKL